MATLCLAAAGPAALADPPPGPSQRVVTIEHLPELGVTSAQLAGGAWVHHRRMDADGRVRAALAIASPALAALDEPERQALAAALAPAEEDARLALERQGVKWRTWARPTGLLVEASAPAHDAAALLAALGSLARTPAVDGERLERWRDKALKETGRSGTEWEIYAAAQAALGRPAPTAAHIGRLHLAALDEALRRAMARASVELGVAGELAPEAALLAAADSFGTLGATDGAVAEAALAARDRAGEVERRIELADEGPRTIVMELRACGTGDDLGGGRRLRMLAEVLESRLRAELRDEQQLAYEVRCTYDPHATPRHGALILWLVASPKLEKVVLRRARRALDSIAQEAPAEDELLAAAAKWAELGEAQLADSGFWSMVLAEHRGRGLDLAEVVAVREAYRAITPGAVAAAAQEANDAHLVVRIIAVDVGREGK